MLAKEAALRLGLSPRTLLDYQRRGVITPLRDRFGRWNYTEAHIAAVRAHMASRAVHHIPDFPVPRTFSRARGC